LQNTILLLTPPFTQLNTPYPATAYLKGFLNTKNISSFQADLGIEITTTLFSKNGLGNLFSSINNYENFTSNANRIFTLKEKYIHTIDSVITFLQGQNKSIATLICKRNYLPEASRFAQLDELDIAFGTMGLHDKAMHLATLYLEDISDFIQETVDPHFGFSRYAEKLARSANTFDKLYTELQKKYTFIDVLLIENLKQKIETLQPKLVCLSVPFPGNVYTAFRCGQWIKKNHPYIKVAMGGGFPNTELRSLSDVRVFEMIDFITLDDGEAPIELLYKYIQGDIKIDELKRTFLSLNNVVTYINNTTSKDYKQGEVGTPDYSDFLLNTYISAIEIANPMHSLWSNGRWNKLTMAHGCYWGKCTFCDISLDYIQRYEPITATLLCDRMETIIAQTDDRGFHFVDEAAPPALMKAMSKEIIKRQLQVTWWANIRFDKTFTRDTCILLKQAGCIAVSGGLEVASDRLLALIDKGITVSQVAKVNKHFTEAGIMVHAYLMYGFPTQTAQETIDSLEMVRQLFETGVLQSGFWHQFAMTAHSPVGLNPEKFNVKKVSNTIGTFANNDIEHIDETGAKHELFSFGLKKSLLNYMHGTCFDYPLQKWFDFKVPNTKISPTYILDVLNDGDYQPYKKSSQVLFTGCLPTITFSTKSKKGNIWEIAELTFETLKETITIKVDKLKGIWLLALLNKIKTEHNMQFTIQDVIESFEQNSFEDFELFWDNKPMNALHKIGLLLV
jgi:radical SAM superfamily enzyme YgiQ (UPF0313 family)